MSSGRPAAYAEADSVQFASEIASALSYIEEEYFRKILELFGWDVRGR